MITATIINTPEQITYVGNDSPIHIIVEDANIINAEVLLYIWNGNLNTPPSIHNHRFKKNKIGISDTYIEFEISEYIKSFLVAPPNAPNTSQPTFVYNELANPTITGQAVFWQVQTIVTTTTSTTVVNHTTNVATLGYKYNTEINFFNPISIVAGGASGFDVVREKYYDPKIHNYINQSFDLTKPLGTCTTANVIKQTDVTPPAEWKRCSLEPTLIVYLNKVGLFEMFTTHGKVVVSSKFDSDDSPRLYRRASAVDQTFQHSKIKANIVQTQTYTINTGNLKESMSDQIEEILTSEKVYLIRFKGDLNITTTTGVTIDNTYITIDDLNTTIDGLSVTGEYLSFFKTHLQIPVICTGSDFVRKTRLNDRKDINYTLVFEETTNKINNLR